MQLKTRQTSDIARRTVPILAGVVGFIMILAWLSGFDGWMYMSPTQYDVAFLLCYLIVPIGVVMFLDELARFPSDPSGYERLGVHAVRVVAITSANRIILSPILVLAPHTAYDMTAHGVVEAIIISSIFLPGPVLGAIVGWEWANRKNLGGGRSGTSVVSDA